MHQRTFTLAWAALGLVVSFAAPVPANAADDCLSGPKATTPAGQHWYYRIDRATKKHCWYLGEHGTRVDKTAAAKSAVAGTEETRAAPLEESVADARAELPSENPVPSPNITAATPNVAPSETERAPGASPSSEAPPRLTERDLITQGPITLASRLPLPNEFQPADPQPDKTAQIAVPARSEPQQQQSATQDKGAHIGPMQIFLSALAIALALAAILGRFIFQYVAGARRKQATQIRRRQIWPDDISQDNMQPSYAQMITPERRARVVRVEQDIPETEHLLRSGSRHR